MKSANFKLAASCLGSSAVFRQIIVLELNYGTTTEVSAHQQFFVAHVHGYLPLQQRKGTASRIRLNMTSHQNNNCTIIVPPVPNTISDFDIHFPLAHESGKL